MRALIGSLILLSSASAWAYDSKCYHPDGGACAEGPDATRHRWIGTLDEHRELFSLAASFSGVPASLFADFDLPVFLSDQTVSLEGRPSPSFIAPELSAVKVVSKRTTSVAEFAQLPDFSFSLADWALGNETCPLDPFLPVPVAAERCHAFKGHMGALNSNHFLPQSQDFYAAYHSRALARAVECRHLKEGIPMASRDRFKTFFADCQREALILEAVGQHFLQDAWSTGHMWERWGSPDPRDFGDLPSATMIAMTAGMIHGVRGVAQSLVEGQQATLGLDELAVLDFDDALCSPHPEVEFVGGQFTSLTPGVGDLYSTELLTDARFDAQRAQFYSCSVSGLRAVYEAAGETPAAPTGNGLRSVDATSDACFGQRVTNAALRKGAGIDLTTATGQHLFIPFEAWLVGRAVAAVDGVSGGLGNPAEGNPAQRSALYRQSMIRLASQLTFTATADPSGTSLASGLVQPLMGIEPNGHYSARATPAPYLDPALPWTPIDGAQPADHWKAALAKTFHRAHALDWCHAFSGGSGRDLDQLKSAVSSATDSKARNVACSVCTEFATRHIRQGTGASDYDQTQEPLCGHFEGDGPVQFIYESSRGLSPSSAAQKWCGCSAPIVSAGQYHTCAVLPGGNARCWGNNSLGPLGNGTQGFSSSSRVPVSVLNLTAATSIQVLPNATCAVTGGVGKCWGHLLMFTNSMGVDLSPVTIPGLSGVKAMSSSYGHFCAALDSGEVKCTGDNEHGQVGNGTTTPLPGTRALSVVSGLPPANSVAAGVTHSCAGLVDGTVRCWGANPGGQLGNGTLMDSLTPVVVTGLTGVIQIAAGDSHTCALRGDGTVACWGFNSNGQLGDGTTIDKTTPVEVPGIDDAIALSVSVHGRHTCVIRRSGQLSCWGTNAFGQLGDGTTMDAHVPHDVPGMTDVSTVSAGTSYTCAGSVGKLHCWGANGQAQLGIGSIIGSLVPVEVTGL